MRITPRVGTKLAFIGVAAKAAKNSLEERIMADYISGSINFQGLGSGTDFSSIIAQLKQVESIPMNRMISWKADWQTRAEAFETVLQSMRDAKSALSQMDSRDKFITKIANSSNPQVATISATGSALDGNHSIEVTQLASNAIWSCQTEYASKSSSISTQNTQFTYTYKGQTRTLQIAGNTSLDSFVNMINNDPQNKGIRASIVQSGSGYRLQIQGMDSGKDATLNITPTAGLNFISAPAWQSSKSYAASDTIWGAGTGAGEFKYTLGFGDEQTIAIDNTTTLAQLISDINDASGPDTAKLDDNGKLVIAGATSVKGPATAGTIGASYWNSSKAYGLNEAVTPMIDVWKSSNSVADLSAAIHDGSGQFNITVNGTTRSILVTDSTSLQDLVAKINNVGFGKIASAEAVDGDSANGYVLRIDGATAFTGVNGASLAGSSAPDGDAKAFNFTIGSDNFTADVLPGVSTAQDLVNAVNAAYRTQYAGADDVAALVQNADGKYAIQIAGAASAHGAGVNGSSSQAANGLTITPGPSAGPGGANVITVSNNSLPGGFTFDGWVVKDPQNAKFKLDNWPDELESTSNNISGVLDGVTMTVFDLGKAQLSVATDADSVQQNIQKFLDAINSVLLTIRGLTKVDDSTSGYNFSVATQNSDNSSSAQQIGSVLTGNYGVQLLNSRMSSLASGTPPGFQKIQGSDLLSGDLISSLSQIGIKTVSDKDDPNYGLLVIAPSSTTSGMQDMDQQAFNEALSTKLDALINFFACDDEGSSTSADFRYASHVKGGTKAGTYDVSYTVSYDDAAPDVPIIDVYIDGKKAVRDSSMEGYWFTSANGPSAGLAIQIDNLSEGAHSGKVSIKQGKIREMEDFLTSETKSYDSINHTGGALEILKSNYADIMADIDKKIALEQTRLSNWEQTQKLAFARLDTLLGQYNANQQQLQSSLAQLQ